MKTDDIVVAVIGIAAFIVFGFNTNWQATVCLFVLLWTNNISQSED